MNGLGSEFEHLKGLGSQLMTKSGPTRSEESNYFVLLNTLKEAHLQMEALEVPPEAKETLLGLVDFCQSDFNQRFR
jgi:hypothetical protein